MKMNPTNEDEQIDIYMDNRSVVDMRITFMDTNNAKHYRHRLLCSTALYCNM
jgi:hypothetical protein